LQIDTFLTDTTAIGDFLIICTEKATINTKVVWSLAVLLLMYNQDIGKHSGIIGIATEGLVLDYETTFASRE